ncbi:MAG: DMT family transporter, partial [Pseudomonadota bacterium]
IVTGLGHTPAAIAGVLILIQPVVAAAISWQLFEEPLEPIQAVGGLLILVGIFVSQCRTESKPSHELVKPADT